MRSLILGALVAASTWLVWRSLRPGTEKPGTGTGARVALVQDPVCHTYIPKDTAVVLNSGGSEHYFCSERCAEAFRDQS
jgi:YHS domain-containing protein